VYSLTLMNRTSMGVAEKGGGRKRGTCTLLTHNQYEEGMYSINTHKQYEQGNCQRRKRAEEECSPLYYREVPEKEGGRKGCNLSHRIRTSMDSQRNK